MKYRFSLTNSQDDNNEYAKKDILKYVIFIVIFRIILDWIYSNIITEYYAYANFAKNPNHLFFVFSWIILFLGIYFSWHNYLFKKRLSNEVIYLLFIVTFVPFTSMVGHGQFELDYVLYATTYWMLLFVLQRLIPPLKTRKIRVFDVRIKDLNRIISVIAVLGVILVVYISGRYAHFRLNFTLNSDIVYDLRQQAAEINLPAYIRYPFMWTQAIMPILIVLFISEKKYVMTVLCVISQFLSFGYDGQKTPILMTVLAIVLSLVSFIKVEKMNKWILIGILSVSVIAIAEIILFRSIWVAGVITRRVFFLPSLVSNYYYDFFSTNTPDFFRSGILSSFFNGGPYPRLQNTIGDLYAHDNSWMNNGLIADAITNFGKIGVFIFPWFVVLVLRVLDRCSEGIDKTVFILCSLSIALSLNNTFLSVALLSHGILVLMILLQIMKRRDYLLTQNERNENDS